MIMKRIISIVLALLLAAAAYAGPVSKEKALDYARQFFNLKSTSSLEIVWTGSGASANAPFYAINNSKGGFIIVSGEEAVNPVLGYSHSGRFAVANMPDNILGWFDSLEKDIKEVRKRNISQSEEVAEMWAFRTAKTKAAGEVILETATWGQGSPYNDLCDVKGGKAVTGCVATAMAIVLRYLGYPEHGTGTLPSYYTSTTKEEIKGYSIDDHFYKWDKMPLDDNDVKKASDEQKLQIAQLMHDCGVMVNMDYTTSSSGAFSWNIGPALSKYMGYCSSANDISKSVYSPAEWISMLMSEIDSDMPVLYAATDSRGAGGHQFVIDGYDAEGRLHVNWGWNGKNNGFYAINLQVGSYSFSNDQSAVIGLAPDPEHKSSPKFEIELSNVGLSIESGTIKKDTEFSVNFDYISNTTRYEFKGVVAAALLGKDDVIKEVISEPEETTIKAATSTGTYYICRGTLPCKIKGDIGFHDKVGLVFRSSSDPTWNVVKYDRTPGIIGYISATPYMFLDTKTRYSAGDILDLNLIINQEELNDIEWYFDGERNYGVPVALTPGDHELKAVVKKKDGVEILVQNISVQ